MEGKKNKHILIVEDAPDLQLLLGRVLEREGYKVSRAFNGKEALDLLNSPMELPAMILLDIMMPVMDGIQFREEQRKNPRLNALPVVAMTASTDVHNIAEKIGVSTILRKPISIDSLIKVARDL